MAEEVKAICKVCGRAANANEFVLDASFGMMACPMCIRDKGNKDKLEKEQQKRQEDDQKKREENEVIVTKGDPEVESAYREKQQEIEKEREKALKVKKLDENKVKYTCQKCHYEFIYKLDKNSPSNCPYCGEKVQSFVVE